MNLIIKEVKNEKELKSFINFSLDLYKDNKNAAYSIKFVLINELKEQVLKLGKYKALLCFDDDLIVGRILYCFEKELDGSETCYFSYFDFVNDFNVAKVLYDAMLKDCEIKHVSHLEGPYAPYDPDTRRGVLVEGFDLSASLFNTYNFEYYKEIYEKLGFTKAQDTLSLSIDYSDETLEKFSKLDEFFSRNSDVEILTCGKHNKMRFLQYIFEIMSAASDDINYRHESPDFETIKSSYKSLRLFLDVRFVKVAIEKSTNKPVGFCLLLPDYNQILRETKGKFNLFKLMFAKRRIKRIIGKLQYVIPSYQKTGLIASLFFETFKEFRNSRYTDFEAGTILENNLRSSHMFTKFGGKIIKRYRIYRTDI